MTFKTQANNRCGQAVSKADSGDGERRTRLRRVTQATASAARTVAQWMATVSSGRQA